MLVVCICSEYMNAELNWFLVAATAPSLYKILFVIVMERLRGKATVIITTGWILISFSY